jgi:hypothetical protein
MVKIPPSNILRNGKSRIACAAADRPLWVDLTRYLTVIPTAASGANRGVVKTHARPRRRAAVDEADEREHRDHQQGVAAERGCCRASGTAHGQPLMSNGRSGVFLPSFPPDLAADFFPLASIRWGFQTSA